MTARDFRNTSHTQYDDCKRIAEGSFRHYVESALAGGAVGDYIGRCAAASFLAILPVAAGSGFETDSRNIRNWLALMLCKGMTPLTLRRYLGRLHTFYTGYAGETEAGEVLFGELRGHTAAPATGDAGIAFSLLRAVKHLPGKLTRLPEGEALWAKVLLYMLFTGTTSYAEIADLKFSAPVPGIEQAREIAASMPSQRRTYVFPLGQGKNRPEALRRKINAALSGFVASLHGTPLPCFSQDTVAAIWVAAALEAGISPGTIAGTVGRIPDGCRWLSAAEPERPDESRRLEILRRVADHISPSASRWYAMYMRPGNGAESIRERVEGKLPGMSRQLDFFYPTRMKKVKKDGKTVRTREPYLPGILFFKTRPDCVAPLFSEIGDMAWCFRTTASPGAPYAVIPRRDMDNFRDFIGIHDDAPEVEVVRSADFVPERRVRITGGIFKGKEGTVYRQKGRPQEGDMRIFLLTLTDDRKVKWQVSIEERFLETV